MTKGAEAFRSIGEVAKLLGVAPHVLRYWETQFPLLKPMKRPDGRRYYRPDDVRLAAGLCTVLRDEGLTIRGARMLLARDRGAALRERGSARLADMPEPQPAPQGEEVEQMSQPAPRSRHRRRRAHPADARLPLFNDLDHAAAHPGWLGRLVALNVRLQGLGDRDSAIRAAGPALARLRDALARIC